MKNLIFVVILLFIASSVYSQADAVRKTYPESFMEVVKTHNEEGLNNLYTDLDANLYVTRKYKDGAKLLFKATSSGWAETVGINPNPYELRISQFNVDILGNIAISNARFDEYDDHKHGQDGYDLFTYFKTKDGWKINHMNVSIAFDFDDIEEKIENTVDQEKLIELNKNILSSLESASINESCLIDSNWRADIGLYKSGNLTSLKHLNKTEFLDFLKSNFNGKIKIITSKLSSVDGYLGYTTAKFLDPKTKKESPLIITYINYEGNWYWTSLQIEINE
ncbi:MAG: hypothetical protein RLO81_18165 [Fulvivirga sp.]|uniref:hypothetical protein n=1 Tax=Fulvivirga sp. TaxID=1931237 RepID=UPI0032EE1F0E